MNILDELVHTTVRIECRNAKGQQSSGTGFFCLFDVEGSTDPIPAIVTNKHVIAGAETGTFHISLADESGVPVEGNHHQITITSFTTAWYPHPEPDVDLTVMPAAVILGDLAQKGLRPFFKAIDNSLMAFEPDLKELSAIESILMVGYPIGLWDAKNNAPIVRRGITATPPYLDFNGKKEFMIDCACFPGSSGSPVFLYNGGSYLRKEGGISIGGRVKFIGVLWGGPQHTATGEIRVVPVPTSSQPIAVSQIPMNLGYCIKAEKLLAFKQHFKQRLEQEKAEKEKAVWRLEF